MKETTKKLSELSDELKELIEKAKNDQIEHSEAAELVVHIRAGMSKLIKELKIKAKQK